MIDAGLLEEIRNLPMLSPTAEKAIGVREMRALLAGHASLTDAVTAIQIATRQYARRQEKWFKREAGFKPVVVSDTDTTEDVLAKITSHLPVRE
jgi:tRNA dimethylallyltransferase